MKLYKRSDSRPMDKSSRFPNSEVLFRKNKETEIAARAICAGVKPFDLHNRSSESFQTALTELPIADAETKQKSNTLSILLLNNVIIANPIKLNSNQLHRKSSSWRTNNSFRQSSLSFADADAVNMCEPLENPPGDRIAPVFSFPF